MYVLDYVRDRQNLFPPSPKSSSPGRLRAAMTETFRKLFLILVSAILVRTAPIQPQAKKLPLRGSDNNLNLTDTSIGIAKEKSLVEEHGLNDTAVEGV
jgi:hypothetical protein